MAAFAPATAQKNINLDILSPIRLTIAPIDEQEEIVDRIEKAFSWIDRLASDARMRIATGQIADDVPTPQLEGKEPAAVMLGRKGGESRAKKLSKRERRDIAKIAAKARWNRKS